jgi:hypothetical protein
LATYQQIFPKRDRADQQGAVEPPRRMVHMQIGR